MRLKNGKMLNCINLCRSTLSSMAINSQNREVLVWYSHQEEVMVRVRLVCTLISNKNSNWILLRIATWSNRKVNLLLILKLAHKINYVKKFSVYPSVRATTLKYNKNTHRFSNLSSISSTRFPNICLMTTFYLERE